MDSVGERIRSLRKQKGMTQDALAEAINANRVTIARYETDAFKPGFDAVRKLAAVLGTTAEELGGGGPSDVDPETLFSGLSDEEKKALDRFVWLLKESGDRSIVEHAIWTVNSLYDQVKK